MDDQRSTRRVDLASFEALYRADDDPWRFATSPYEQHRYSRTVAHLPRPHYHRCFEPGCSVGVLTARLADRADEVVAVDASPAAVHQARQRLDQLELTNVHMSVGAMPENWPPGRFDLIVFSELGYYFTEEALGELAARVHDTLTPGGDVVAVHWLGQSPDHVLAGARVHEVLSGVLDDLGAEHLGGEVDPGELGERFVIDVWRRRG